jgi:hypothetical protein
LALSLANRALIRVECSNSFIKDIMQNYNQI